MSRDNSSTFNIASNSIITATAGIVRPTVAGALGGANAKFNLNGATLDLRTDTTFTLTAPVTVGANNSFINVDRAIGGSGTGGTQTLNGLSLGTFTLFLTSGNTYSLNTGTVTLTGAGTITNNIGSGGLLTIPSLTGAQTVVFSGSGATTVSSVTGSAITKSGAGTVTLTEPATPNTTGKLTINAGAWVADYSTGSATTIFAATDTLAIAGGTLQIKGAATGSTAQTLGNVAVGAGGLGQIILTPQGAGATNLTTGTLTATTAGGGLLVNAPANTAVLFNTAMNSATTLNGRSVFFDGMSYNWLANTGANTTSIPYSSYNPVAGTTLTANVLNDQISSATANETTTGATVATNSLMINAQASGQSLAMGTAILTLTNGGLLFTGANDYAINAIVTSAGLKSGIASTSDFVINDYGTGKLTINAAILHANGTDTLTVNGTGTVILGGVLGANLNTYTGTTFLNGGTLQMANATHLGAASTQGLTINGGTFDLNGNTGFTIGGLAGGASAIVDNTSATPVNFIIGSGTGAGTFIGTIQNTGGAVSITKIGTGTITLGDTSGSSNFTYSGDLTNSGGTTSIIAVTAIPDLVSTKINLGTATPTDSPTFKFVGNSSLTLNNRQFDLNNVSGGTIDASGVVGLGGTAAVLIVNSNLLLDGSGSKTLTLQGSAGNVANGGTGSGPGDGVSGMTGSGNVALVNSFNSVLSDPSGGSLALTIAGTGGWALTANNAYSGGTTISSTGLVRATSATAFGSGPVNVTGTAIVDLRSDSSPTFGNVFTMNSSFTINVDRALGGSGYGQIMNIGALTESTTGKTLTVTNLTGTTSQTGSSDNVDGYGLHIAGLNLNAGTATTITNDMGSPGAAMLAVPTAPATGVAGALVIDGVTAAASLGTHTLTISSAANTANATIINGDITQGSGTTLAINFTPHQQLRHLHPLGANCGH